MPVFDFQQTSSVTIIPQTPTPLLDSFRLDAATGVSRTFPGAVSRHGVQSGREGITDSVRVDPDTLAVTGLVSDLPLSLGAFIAAPGRAARMADLLEQLRAQRSALRVVTSWTGALDNRWISQFSLTRGATTGRAIEITMTIEKLRIVRTRLVSQQLDSDIQLLGTSTTEVGEF